MVNDSLADMVTRIRNGYMARQLEVKGPKTKLVIAVAEVLVKYKYVKSLKVENGEVIIELNYVNKLPAIMGIKKYSKPGQRIYAPYKNIPKVWGRLGINILSTSKGVMGEKEAKKAKLGGELLVQVW